MNGLNIEIEENTKESTDNDDDSNNYEIIDDSTEFSEENINIDDSTEFSEENINIDDIENDDFHDIYEWTNELSFENTFKDTFANLKI